MSEFSDSLKGPQSKLEELDLHDPPGVTMDTLIAASKFPGSDRRAVYLRVVQLYCALDQFLWRTNHNPSVTFAEVLEYSTPIALELHGVTRFTEDERRSINREFLSRPGRYNRLIAVARLLNQWILPTLPTRPDNVENRITIPSGHEDVELSVKTLGEDAGHYGLKVGDKIIHIALYPDFRDTQDDKTLYALQDVLRYVAQYCKANSAIKGIGSKSWLFSTSAANHLGFIPSRIEEVDNVYTMRDPWAWLQLFNGRGNFNKRLNEVVKYNMLPYVSTYGFMDRDTLIKRYDANAFEAEY